MIGYLIGFAFGFAGGWLVHGAVILKALRAKTLSHDEARWRDAERNGGGS